MNYSNILTIQDGTKDTLFGVLIICSVLLLVNAFGALQIFKKKQKLIHEAKRLVESKVTLNNVKLRKEEQ